MKKETVMDEANQTKVQKKLIMEVVENEVMKEGPFEGDRRAYTLRNHKGIQDYFEGALKEAGKGDTFQAALCLYKDKNGVIGMSYHVRDSGKILARTPGGPEEPDYHHYNLETGKIEGAYGRIMAEDVEPFKLRHLKEHGKGITEKGVSLSPFGWCIGTYCCG